MLPGNITIIKPIIKDAINVNTNPGNELEGRFINDRPIRKKAVLNTIQPIPMTTDDAKTDDPRTPASPMRCDVLCKNISKKNGVDTTNFVGSHLLMNSDGEDTRAKPVPNNTS